MNQALELKQIKYQNLKQILKVTVETTKKKLQCDRAIIYNAVNLPHAGVLAESVDVQYASLLGQTIEDPFLKNDYLEMYCYGMSLTIDDIYTSDITLKERKNLERIEVKSVAIAPIYVDNKLLAFLAAHHCSASKPWDLEAVNFLAEKASAAGLALSSVTKGANTQDLNLAEGIESNQDRQTSIPAKSSADSESSQKSQHPHSETLIQQTRNKLFADIKDKIIDEVEPKDLLDLTVEQTRQLLQCDRVLIFSFNEANYGVVAESVGKGWTKALNRVEDDSSLAAKYLEEDRDGKARAWNNTDDDDAPSWYKKQLNALEVKAGLIAPIAHEGQLFGLLIAHQCSQPRIWQGQEIEWITQIANHTSNMVENIKSSNGIKQDKKHQPADVRQQLQQEKMWTQHFADAIGQIRKSLKVKDILKASVGEVHRVLNCDRVLVYTLNHDSYGKIVAESVSPGWTKVEGRVIKDPCFEARYLEKYRDGRYRAWNDIYQAGMTSCHIEQLERLEVKANLVVPVINEGKLFGLLVAQQCSATRQWQQPEILWLIQIATQVGFAIDNSQLMADAQRLRQQAEQERMWTEYFTDAVQQIRQSLKTQDVYKASVREVRRVLNCDRVLVYGLNQDNYGKIAAESVAHGWTRGEGRIIQDPCFEARYLDKYRDGRVRVWDDIYQAGMTTCHIEQLERLEVKANLVVPITNGGKLFGLLVAQQCSGTRQWQQPEIDWLVQVAFQVALAVENAQMLEQIEQNTKTTQAILARAADSSASIRRTVQSVTAGFANLSNSCQSFAKTIQQVKDLSKQLAQQSMGMSRVINLSQVEDNNRDSVGELSDHVFSLMQELFEATAKIDPLFASIQTEINTKASTLEAETESLISGVDDFQTASQKLEEIVALNSEMSNLVVKISDSLDTQIQSSTFAKDSVDQLVDITERISQQSVAIIQSLNQL